jgi:hypothetical protein
MNSAEKTNSAVRALAIAQDIATRTLAGALIYDECGQYTVVACSVRIARQTLATNGAAIGDYGHVVGVLLH